jgi:hypothetical protein
MTSWIEGLEEGAKQVIAAGMQTASAAIVDHFRKSGAKVNAKQLASDLAHAMLQEGIDAANEWAIEHGIHTQLEQAEGSARAVLDAFVPPLSPTVPRLDLEIEEVDPRKLLGHKIDATIGKRQWEPDVTRPGWYESQYDDRFSTNLDHGRLIAAGIEAAADVRSDGEQDRHTISVKVDDQAEPERTPNEAAARP